MGITSGHPDVPLHGVGIGRRWVCEGRLRGVGEATHRALGAPWRSSSSTRIGAGQHETTLISPRFFLSLVFLLLCALGAPRRSSSSTRLGEGQHEATLISSRFIVARFFGCSLLSAPLGGAADPLGSEQDSMKRHSFHRVFSSLGYLVALSYVCPSKEQQLRPSL